MNFCPDKFYERMRLELVWDFKLNFNTLDVKVYLRWFEWKMGTEMSALKFDRNFGVSNFPPS